MHVLEAWRRAILQLKHAELCPQSFNLYAESYVSMMPLCLTISLMEVIHFKGQGT